MPKTVPTTRGPQSPMPVHLSDQARVSLRDLTLTRTYDTGEMIFREGEPSSSLWLVECGRVRLFKTAPDGHELTISIVHATDRFCLGTCPLFDGDVNPVSAQALEPVRLSILDKRQVAARMARGFDRWKKFDAGRQTHSRAALESLRDHPGLSRDVFEIVTRALG